MESKEFLLQHGNELVQLLRDYLGGKIDHQKARDYAWKVIHASEQARIPNDAARTDDERAFWGAIWSLQHLADEEHWSENVTQPELRRHIQDLTGEKSLQTED